MTEALQTDSVVFAIVRGHIEAQASDSVRKRHLYALGGVAGLIGLTGLGVGLGCLGFAEVEQKSTAAETIGLLLARAIAANPIHASVAGTVSLAPGSHVAIADGASVALAADQKVTLDRNATVTVETPTVTSRLTPTQAQLQTSADDNLSNISTTYTVFHSQPYRNGRIESGWQFNVQNVDAPSYQYCNYIVEKDDRHAYRILIASNMNPAPSMKSIAGFDWEEAFQKCVWVGRAS